MQVVLAEFTKKAGRLISLFLLFGCSSSILSPLPKDVLGDIGYLAEVLERGNNCLAERSRLLHCNGHLEWPQQIALITAFENATALSIDFRKLRAIWEQKFAERSRCRLIWGQNWDEETIATQLDVLRLRFAQQSFEQRQNINLTLARIELLHSPSDISTDCFSLCISWQDPSTRSEIDRIEISLMLDPARFSAKRSVQDLPFN